MKYDLNKKMTKGAKRTLDAFSKTMADLISQKSFEKISINEICDISGYPRATFYNYFDDKYDLLNYCCKCVCDMIRLDEYDSIAPEKRLEVFFKRLYTLAEKNEQYIKDTASQNRDDGYLFGCIKIYVNSFLQNAFEKCEVKHNYTLPDDMVAQHFSNTIMLVLEWRFINKNDCSYEQALNYLSKLLNFVN